MSGNLTIDYFLAVGRNGSDDYYWIVWKDGDQWRHFVPYEDNYAQPRELPVVAGPGQEAIAMAMDAAYKNRAPFRLFPRRLSPGAYYPRIRRGELINNEVRYELSTLTVDTMNLRHALSSSASAARLLFNRMKAVFELVEPVPSHANVYGNELRHLLILACTEVESAWRSILVANGYTADPNKPLSTKDYVQLLEPMQLDKWKAKLLRSQGTWIIAPFEKWDAARPTKSLRWYDSFNATKHDREAHLGCATLESVIHALAAVYVMLVSQFGADNVLNAGLDDFVVEQMPTTEPLDAYVRNYRTDYGPVPLWFPVPLFPAAGDMR